MKSGWLFVLGVTLAACRVESPQQPARNTAPNGLSVVATTGTGNAASLSGVVADPLDSVLKEPINELPNEPDGGSPRSSEPVYAFQQVDLLKRSVGRDVPARRYANLSPTLCARELSRSKYPFKRVGAFKGIATPVRVNGDIEGVKFRVPGSSSKFGVLDCRLALTLTALAKFLQPRGVTEVTVDNFYRPNARLPSKRSQRSQHAYGLAIDLTSFKLSDGRVLHVEHDWGAGIETEPCGPGATLATATKNTVDLRQLVCDLAAAQIFNRHLTPSYNTAHRNHLHLDIKRDEATVTVR
jgi:hypothetical protein